MFDPYLLTSLPEQYNSTLHFTPPGKQSLNYELSLTLGLIRIVDKDGEQIFFSSFSYFLFRLQSGIP